MDKELIELIENILDETLNDIVKEVNTEKITYTALFNKIKPIFDKILNIIKYFNDVKNGKWIEINDTIYPNDFGLDWVLVQFMEKSGFVGLPYIAEFNKEKNIWKLQSDDKAENYYINNDCIASSWKIIEPSPEWLKDTRKL